MNILGAAVAGAVVAGAIAADIAIHAALSTKVHIMVSPVQLRPYPGFNPGVKSIETGSIGVSQAPAYVAPPPAYHPPTASMPVDASAPITAASLDTPAATGIVTKYVKEKLCYGSGPVQKMQVNNISMSTSFDVNLQTFVETRHILQEQTPYRGEPIDPMGSGPVPGVWELAIAPNNAFQDGIQKITLPHTDVVSDCMGCHARGHVNCPTCVGAGQHRCHPCNATGRINCHSCHGSGHNNCHSCHGSGRINQPNGQPAHPCHACHSSGKIHCHPCHGKGQITCHSCHGCTMVLCESCDAYGRVQCRDCQAMCRILSRQFCLAEFRTHTAKTILPPLAEGVAPAAASAQPPSSLVGQAGGVTVCTINAHQVADEHLMPYNLRPDVVQKFHGDQQIHMSMNAGAQILHRQKFTCQAIPINKVDYTVDSKPYTFWIIGTSMKVWENDYAATCCFCRCNIM